MVDRLKELRAKLDRQEGITWQQGCFIFCVTAVLLWSRWPDLLTHPQFYGEDGTVWYDQAYEAGWIHSLVIPCQGYLNSLQRLGAGFSLLVPFHQAPFVMALFGLLMQCIPVLVLLSSRCRDWGSLSLRVLWAGLYIALPNTKEIHVVLTNSQWHLLLATILLAFGRPPRTWLGKVLDALCFTIVGLSGPFCLILLPLLCVYWWKCRYKWTLVQAGLTAICSAVQVWFLHFPGNRVTTPLGVNFERTVRLFGGNVIGGTLLGGNHEMGIKPLPLLIATAIFGVVVFGYVLRHGRLQLKLFVLYSLLLLSASLKSPMIGGDPRWQALVVSAAARYWFFPMLAFIWCVAWCSQRARHPFIRKSAAVWLCLALVGIITGWEFIPFKDVGFAKYAAQFEAARPGTVMVIPEAPASNYHMTIRKK